MKKSAFFALFVFCLVVTSTTAVMAATYAPGCKPEIMAVHERAADAIRARDQGYSRQLIRQNDPALGLSCFDQQLKLTSTLASIFSGKTSGYSTTSLLSPSTFFAGLLSFPGGPGAGRNLARDLGTVVAPVLGGVLGNFTGALSAILGGIGGDILPGILGGLNLLGGILGGGAMPTVNIDCTRLQDVWNGSGSADGTTVEGRGVMRGTPYLSFRDFVGGALGSMGADFILSMGGNSSILSSAMSDLTTPSTGGLGGSTWLKPIVYSPSSSTDAILACISSGSTACD